MHFAAEGYPPKIAAGKIPQQFSGIFNNFAMGLNRNIKKSAALLFEMKIEIAMKGKSEGITEK